MPFLVLLLLLGSQAAGVPADPSSTTTSQGADDPQKPRAAETIVVTATRSEREVSELPVSTTVVDEETLKVAAATSVDDLLRTVPGVQMPLSSSSVQIASNSDISMRGLGETRALVLLDGVPLHDPYYGTVQWQKVPLDSLRQVEVVRGASGSLFGNYALGGAVNLRTRPVEESSVRLDAATGSAETDRFGVTVDHVLTPRLGLRLSYHDSDTIGFYRQPNPGPVDIRAWNDTAVASARADYQPSDTTRFHLSSNWSRIGVSQGTPLALSNRELFDVAAGLQRAAGKNALLSATFFHQSNDDHLTTTLIPSGRLSESLSSDANIPSHATGASLEYSLQRSGSVPFFSVGIDVNQIHAKETRDSYSRGAFTRRNIVNGRQQFAGAFAQVSWQPGTRLEVLTSARLDYYSNSDGSDAVQGGAVTTYAESTSTQLDPRVSVRYALAGNSALRASVYRAFRAPTLRDLYRNSQSGSTVLLGNPDLGPEALVGGEVGYEWSMPRLRLEATLYRSEVEGLMARGPVPGQPSNVTMNYNLGTARAQGIEVMANMSLSRRLLLDAGYTYADSVVTEDPDPAVEGNRLPDVPMHYGTVNLRFVGDGGARLALRGRIVSSIYGEPTNAIAAPAHRILDLSASYPLRPWLDVWIIGENVFDERYWYVLTPTSFRTAQPRIVTAGLRADIPWPGKRH